HIARGLRFLLSALTVEHSIAALRDVAQASGIPASSVERVARQCAGNPLRLFHVARSLAAGEQPSQMPVRTRDVLADRMQRLSSIQRRVFLVLALLGRPAAVQLLAAASHVSEDSCRDAVRLLEKSGFVEQVEGGANSANDLA